MQKQEKKFSTGHRSSFWIKLSFGIGHPPAIHQIQCICVGEGSRVPNLQTEFNYLDSFKSYGIFSDFVVPVVPMLSLSSPLSPRHLHSPQKVPMWSPWLWSPWSPLSPPHVVPMLSPWSPHHPHGPHVIPVSFQSSPHHPHSPQKVPMWSPWLWSPWSPLSPPHVVPMLSCWSPCHPHRPHVIPVLSLSSPHHLEGPKIIPNSPDTYSTSPSLPLGDGGPQISKNVIRFELIEMF